MQTGTIVTYYVTKSYGFIQAEDGTDRFFHITRVAPGYTPKIGERVQFRLDAPSRLGRPDQAVDVKPLESTVDGGAL